MRTMCVADAASLLHALCAPPTLESIPAAICCNRGGGVHRRGKRSRVKKNNNKKNNGMNERATDDAGQDLTGFSPADCLL